MEHPDKKGAPGEGPGTPVAGCEARPKIQKQYTSFLKKSQVPTLKEQRALWWLERDFLLLPVQPNSKKLVPRFGFYLDKIATPERVHQWFSEKSLANIAVCGTQTSLILDFDDPDLYKFWTGKFPTAARTYTEQTPDGGYHVFAHVWGESLKGVKPIKGVELKHTALIYPSIIDNKPYSCGAGDLLDLDAELVLSPLSQAPIVKPFSRVGLRDKSKLQKIKAAFSCLELIQSINPNVKVYGPSKRFVTVACPFHDDKEPSCWIDTARNLWGCHACDIHGDVINLYARLKGITNNEAILEMGKTL